MIHYPLQKVNRIFKIIFIFFNSVFWTDVWRIHRLNLRSLQGRGSFYSPGLGDCNHNKNPGLPQEIKGENISLASPAS
jgi:hypothetical protein